jgi:hypothetical protein
MTATKRQSLAATLRLSLLAGAGALGWIALGATGASAAEVPATSGLLGSVSDVVGAVSAPAGSIVNAVVDPLGETTAGIAASSGSTGPLLQSVPLVPGVEARVPQLLTQPAGTVLSPVTSVVDGVVNRVPVVHHVVPAGTVTHVTTPVGTAVDGLVGGVTQPVMDVVAPVVDVIHPVAGVVDPVVDIAAPVVDVAGPPADGLAPVVDVVQPVVEGALPTPESTPSVVAPVPAPALDEDVVPGEAMPVTATEARGSVASLDAQMVSGPRPTASGGPVAATNVDESASAIAVGLARFAAQVPELAVAPQTLAVSVLTTVVLSEQEAPQPPATPVVLAGGALSSMTSAGSAAPLAALGAAAFLVFMMITGRIGREATGALPASPCYDPGSSPD